MPRSEAVIGNFTFTPTELEQVTLITPVIRGDERGKFFEIYQASIFDQAGIKTRFVQENQSISIQGIFRGLHLQYPAYQEKIVRVVQGNILDFAVQVYPENAPNFGKWISVALSGDNNQQLHIGQGEDQGEPIVYGHGFLVTSPDALVCYKSSAVYTKKDELGLNPFDPRVSIDHLMSLDSTSMLTAGLINQRDYSWPGLEKLAGQIWERVPERKVVIPVTKW